MFDQREIERLINRLYKRDTCWFLSEQHAHGLRFHHTGATVHYNGKLKTFPLHKLMYFVHGGTIPDDGRYYVIRHLCGYGGCCNPAHLALGTQRENMRDELFHRKYGVGTLAPEFYD